MPTTHYHDHQTSQSPVYLSIPPSMMGSLAAPKIFVRRFRQHIHTHTSASPFWISSISGGSRRGVVGSTTTRKFHEKDNYLSYDAFDDSSTSTIVDDDPPSSFTSLRIPTHAAHKVCTPSDAVSLISRGDTIAYVHQCHENTR
jgi:hypothetical protein